MSSRKGPSECTKQHSTAQPQPQPQFTLAVAGGDSDLGPWDRWNRSGRIYHMSIPHHDDDDLELPTLHKRPTQRQRRHEVAKAAGRHCTALPPLHPRSAQIGTPLRRFLSSCLGQRQSKDFYHSPPSHAGE
jgi:hypothetical protein